MTKATLPDAIANATSKLLWVAREHSWRTIPDKCVYSLSEIDDSTYTNAFAARKARNRINRQKRPMSLEAACVELQHLFWNLHDINLQVYKAEAHRTIVEIRFFLMTSLDEAYRQSVQQQPPMLHCKVPIPAYCSGPTKQFDINWELGGLRHQCNLFWHRQRFRSKKLVKQ